MIVFREKTLAERFLLLIPSRRRASEERLRQAIAALVNHPTLPCVIAGRVIPDGFGSFIEPGPDKESADGCPPSR